MEIDEDTNNFIESLTTEIGGKPINFSNYEPIFVFPGDDLTSKVTEFNTELSIGFGLVQKTDQVLATCMGKLLFKPPNIYWVEHKKQRYFPMEEDTVIGIVTKSFSERYVLDLNATHNGTLATVAFDGATKRSRPNLEIGSVVYCRVLKSDRDLDPELSCKAPVNVARKDWASGEALFGELIGGLTFNISVGFACKLMEKECAILESLAHFFAFEIAIGMNGIIWIDAKKNDELILIKNSIERSSSLTDTQIPAFVHSLVKAWKQRKDGGKV